jgi:hypothetical protein
MDKDAEMEQWPDMLHCLEFGEQRTVLAPVVKNIWRPIWHGQGIGVLNSCESPGQAAILTLARTASVRRRLGWSKG